MVTVLFWSGSDLFSKIGSAPQDQNSHWKMVIAVGSVMGLHALWQVTAGGVQYDPVNLLRYLPVSALYITSMIFGYAGLRYIELSISSPICNSSGAVVAVLTFATAMTQVRSAQGPGRTDPWPLPSPRSPRRR